ncbi:hypothetical protein AV530_000889 [Patagioenas fasciata monilis]|uniref:Uncharacterized protein n=1 Tax=Patagioenas fasciata monilis TaxID=372326 RepID=A0A1V4KSP5_PATFA|nr:hypothetical protein AV530_000889 [Patagioenas fasciata monilis]
MSNTGDTAQTVAPCILPDLQLTPELVFSWKTTRGCLGLRKEQQTFFLLTHVFPGADSTEQRSRIDAPMMNFGMCVRQLAPPECHSLP